MKFSKKLYERAHPKHRKHYISYKELKKAIKLITGKDTSTYTIREVTSNFGNIRALSGTEYKSTESRFQDLLNFELEKINNFTLNIIKDWFNEAKLYYTTLKEESSTLDIKHVENKLNELGETLIFLEGYKHINFIGFHKITKKFDKHSDKNVSSSFYISNVIKSFFMNFDMNFLVCILSICYKYFRILNNKRDTINRKPLKGINSNRSEMVEHMRSHISKNCINGEKESEIEEKEKEKAKEKEEKEKEEESGRNCKANAQVGCNNPIYDNYSSIKENNNIKNVNIKNMKYIVKLQYLISVKVEIAKYFTFQYYEIEEYEFISNIKKFIEMISTNKIQNYIINIYFDNSNLSTYHSFVNRNMSNVEESVRVRSYNYINGKKHEEKTILQRFNIYEPSHNDNEKYICLKDLSFNNLKIEKINDLRKLKEIVIGNYGELNKKKDNKSKENDIENGIENGIENKTISTRESKKKKGNKHYSIENTSDDNINNANERFLLQNKDFFMSFVTEIKTKNLRSYIKSKSNRLYFSNENLSGYIDENICYWAHNDKKNIFMNEETDDDDDDDEDKEEEEEEAEKEDEQGGGIKTKNKYSSLSTCEDFYQNNNANYLHFNNQHLKMHKNANNKKYYYFDYAVIDISVKEQTNREFILKLNHINMAREIWGYSSFLQGVSLLYPNFISIYPHWRRYTCTEFMKFGSNESPKKNKKKKKKTS